MGAGGIWGIIGANRDNVCIEGVVRGLGDGVWGVRGDF